MKEETNHRSTSCWIVRDDEKRNEMVGTGRRWPCWIDGRSSRRPSWRPRRASTTICCAKSTNSNANWTSSVRRHRLWSGLIGFHCFVFGFDRVSRLNRVEPQKRTQTPIESRRYVVIDFDRVWSGLIGFHYFVFGFGRVSRLNRVEPQNRNQTPVETRQYVAIGFDRVWSGLIGFRCFFGVRTGFVAELGRATGLYLLWTELNGILGFTEFSQCLPGFTGFLLGFSCFPGFSRGFTGFWLTSIDF